MTYRYCQQRFEPIDRQPRSILSVEPNSFHSRAKFPPFGGNFGRIHHEEKKYRANKILANNGESKLRYEQHRPKQCPANSSQANFQIKCREHFDLPLPLSKVDKLIGIRVKRDVNDRGVSSINKCFHRCIGKYRLSLMIDVTSW